MAAEREFTIKVRVTAQGLELIDQAGNKIAEVGRKSQAAGREVTEGFSHAQANLVTFNQVLEFTQRIYSTLAGPISAATRAAAEQETAVAALNSQLQIQGRFTEAFSKSLQDQATALQKVTTFADETVISVQAMLATFPRVSNEILPRATEAVLDFSVAMHSDAVGAAQALGRALQDPADALRVLQQAGIRFSDDQKKLLEQLVSTGQITKAQTLLLDEFARFQGRARAEAETFTGGLKQLKNAFGEVLEEAGNTVIQSDALREGFNLVRAEMIKLAEETRDYVNANREVIESGIRDFFDGLPDSIRAGKSSIREVRDFLRDWAELQEIPIIKYLIDRTPSLKSTTEELKLISDLLSGIAGGVKTGGGFLGNLPGAISAFNARVAQGGGADFGVYGPAWQRFMEELNRTAPQRITNANDPFAVPGDARPQPITAANDPFARAGGGGGSPIGTARRAREELRALDEAQKQANDLALAQQKASLELIERQVTLREQAIDFAQQDLQLAQQQGASYQEQLALAERIDQLEIERLEAVKRRLEAERDRPSFTPEDVARFEEINTQLQLTENELARIKAGFGSVTEEIQRARDVTIDLGAAVNDSLKRVIDGILSGGRGGFNLSNIIQDTLRTLASDIIGGSLQAFLQGGELRIAGLDGFKEGVEKFGIKLDQFAGFVSRIFGGGQTAEPTSIVGPPTEAQSRNEANAAAFNANPNATGAAAAAAGIAGAAGGLLLAIQATINAFEEIKKLKDTITLRNFITDKDVIEAGARGAFGTVGLGGIGGLYANTNPWVRGLINSLFNPLGAIFDIGFTQAPSRGAQLKGSLWEEFVDPLRIPEQRRFNIGDRSGVRTQFIEATPNIFSQAAFAALGYTPDVIGTTIGRASGDVVVQNLAKAITQAQQERPQVEALRTTEFLGIGQVLTNDPGKAAGFANALVNNLLLVGVSAEEAHRQLKKIADESGITLLNSLDELNTQFLQGKVTLQQFQNATAGVIDFFNDEMPLRLREAIDFNALIQRRTIREGPGAGGIDVAGLTGDIQRAGIAFGLREQADDIRFRNQTAVQQERQRRQELAELDARLAADKGLTDTDRQQLLQERAQLGFDLVSIAEQRFAPGSAAQRRAVEAGLAIVEDTAARLEAIGSEITDPIEKQISATIELTGATRDLAAVMKGGLNTKLDVNIRGGSAEVTEATVRNWVRTAVKEVLNGPELKAATKITSFNR